MTDRRVTLGLALYSLGITAWLLLEGVRVTREGGLYYYKIAQNVAAGAGSTFDGVHVTNGYHPLWLLCLVPVFWIRSEPESALRLGILLQGILMAAGASVLYRTLRLDAGRFASGMAGLLWVALIYREALSGLEFGLHALGVLSAAYVYRRWFVGEPPRVSAHLMLGLLLGLASLARLDNLLLSGLLGASLALREARAGLTRDRTRCLLVCALPMAAACVGYIALNVWLCGHALPVSAAVKREWALSKLSQDPYYRAGGWWLAKAHQLLWPLRNASQRYPFYLSVGAFGAGALYAAGALARRRSRWQAWFLHSLQPWWPFVLFSLLQVLAYAVVFHGEFSFVGASHQYVTQPWMTVTLAAAAAHALLGVIGGTRPSRPWPHRVALLGMVVATLALPFLTLASVMRWVERERLGLSIRPDYESAAWVSAHLPADAVIGSWRTGAMAYLSGRRVVDLSGLVNSWEYYKQERQDPCGYWDRNGITYLVDLFEHGRPAGDERVHSSYASCADRLEQLWSDNGYGRAWRMEAYRIRAGVR